MRQRWNYLQIEANSHRAIVRCQEWVEETRPKIAAGLAQLERGEGIDGETVIARLQQKFRQMRENKQ